MTPQQSHSTVTRPTVLTSFLTLEFFSHIFYEKIRENI